MRFTVRIFITPIVIMIDSKAMKIFIAFESIIMTIGVIKILTVKRNVQVLII